MNIPFDIRTVGEDCLAICKTKWHSHIGPNDPPFTWEVGMRVVDSFSEIVHIKDIIKPESTPVGKVPEWCITVEENENTYRWNEISGEFVALVFKNQFERFIKENEIIDFTG